MRCGAGWVLALLRAGDWKLLEYLEDNRIELFHLSDDPGESTNLAAQKPEKASELTALLHAWRASVGAAMPTPNPDFARPKAGVKKAG